MPGLKGTMSKKEPKPTIWCTGCKGQGWLPRPDHDEKWRGHDRLPTCPRCHQRCQPCAERLNYGAPLEERDKPFEWCERCQGARLDPTDPAFEAALHSALAAQREAHDAERAELNRRLRRAGFSEIR